MTSPAAPAAEDLDWLVALLWPEGVGASAPLTGSTGNGPAGVEHYAVLPSREHPRLLLPLDSRRSSAASIRAYGYGDSPRERLSYLLARTGLRAGVVQPFLRSRLTVPADAVGSLRSHLERELGSSGLRMCVRLGPLRVNRKPVLQLLDARGRTVGFAKVGWNELTRRLVAIEAAFLGAVDRQRLRTVRVPQLLHHGTFDRLEVSVVSPLPAEGRPPDRRTPEPYVTALREIAELDAIEEGPLHASAALAALRERSASCTDDATREVVDGALATATARYGDVALATGRWHGDFTIWNVRANAGRLHIWDWERTADHAPIGADAAHFHLQLEHRIQRRPAPQTIAVAREQSARWLALLGVRDDAAAAVHLLYLAELLLRFDRDDRDDHGAPATQGRRDALRAGVVWALREAVS